MPAATACELCGLECGRAAVRRQFDHAERQFCCAGCANVYTILSESGVIASGVDLRSTRLFQQSLKLGLVSTPDTVRRAIPPDAETREALYQVSGMWCASCGWLIERALEREHGVASAEVLFASDLVKVRYCPQYLPPTRIPERIASLGYRARPFTAEQDADKSERNTMILRIGLAFFLWMNVMFFSLPIYASYWEPIWESARRVVPFILWALATPAVFYSAFPVLRVAALGLRHGVLRMEALLALGILAAYFYSATQAVLGGRHYYFDTACAIVTLVLLGKMMERGAKARTAASIALLYRMVPNKARLLVKGAERFVSIEALEPGMIFLVKAGERVPADGVVVAGDSHVDESVLTGESAPLRKTPGSAVACGSLNSASVLEIRATRASADSTLAQMIRAVQAALASRSHIERLVDRVARVFVPVVMLVAAATVAAGLALHLPPTDAILRGIAVLVIACPCALGVATPLAVTAAVGAASRRGILVSDSRVLETIRQVDLAVLDKTGTLTTGDFRLLDLLVSPGASIDEPAVLSLLATVERYSEHPLGAAVVQRAYSLGADLPEATDVRVFKGAGIVAQVRGEPVAIGNRRLMEQLRIAVDPALEQSAAGEESLGRTVSFWSAAGCTGLLVFGDSLRDGARELVATLHARGIRVAIVSGDSEATTAWAARAVGAGEFRANSTPEQKAAIVAGYQASGRTVAMLGDGVNDAPALAAARLGIALGSGADLAMRAAPVVLMAPALSRVVDIFDLAHAVRRIVMQNLFWAFFYNAVGIALAITGLLSPIFAAAAMVLSSLSVILNSMRLNRQFESR